APFGGTEVGESDGFVAVGAEPTRTDSAAEDVTVGTALRPEQPRLAAGALVDDAGAWGVERQRPRGPGRHQMPAAPGGLAAGVGAELASARRVELAPTHEAARLSDRYAIVTRRR